MVADLARCHDFLVVLVDDHLEVEGNLLDDPLVKLGQVVNALVPVHEEVGHRVLVVGLDTLSHLFGQPREPHRNHKVVLNLQASDRAVVLALHGGRTSAVKDGRDLSKHGSRLDGCDEQGHRGGQNLEHVAVASDEEEHLVWVLTLDGDFLVWLVQVEGQLLQNGRRDALIEPKHGLPLDNGVELMFNNTGLYRGAQQFHKSR